MRTLRNEYQDFTFAQATGAKRTRKPKGNLNLLPWFVLECIIVLMEIKYFLG